MPNFPTYPAQTFRSMRAGLRPADQTDYSEAHPFLPSGWNPDPAAPAPGPMPSVSSLSFEDQNKLANSGQYEAGSFGAQSAEANGTGTVIGAAPPVLPARYVTPGPGGVPTQASAAAGTFSNLFGGGATLLDGSPDLGAAAAGLQASQGAYAANRDTNNLRRQGMLPSLTDSPEVSANKYGYLNSRLATVLNGGQPRTPGSPVYGGKPLTGGKSPILSQWDTHFTGTPSALPTEPAAPQITTGDAAKAYQQRMLMSKTPRLVNFAPDVRGLVDAQGNVSRIPNEKTTQQVDVAGRKLTVGPGEKYFDEQGQPVDFGRDTPPRAPDIMMKTLDPELYQAQRDEYMAHVQARKPATKPAAGVGPVTITTEAEFNALPPTTRFIFNGKPGTKK